MREEKKRLLIDQIGEREYNPVSRSIWRRILQFQVLFVHERDSNRGVVDVSHVSPGTVSFVFLEQKWNSSDKRCVECRRESDASEYTFARPLKLELLAS